MRINEIQRQVIAHFFLTMDDMHSSSRKRRVVRARQIGMLLCRELTKSSYPEIAFAFGKEDHTTVMHGVRRIVKLMATNEDVAEAVAVIRKRLNGG